MKTCPSGVLAIAAALLASSSPCLAQSTLANPFGILPARAWVSGSGQSLSTTARIASTKNLGIPYVRCALSHLDTKYDFSGGTWYSGQDGAWQDYIDYVQAGCKTLLNVNWQGSQNGGLGSTFPSGVFLTDYLGALDNILTDAEGITGADTPSPVVLVIENEEANFSYYGNVSRVPYLAQLAGATDIAHDHGIAIADGGFTNVPLYLYVWYHYYYEIGGTTGQALASDFYDRALGPGYFTTYPTLKTTNQEKLDVARTLIEGVDSSGNPPYAAGGTKGFTDLPIDFVNVHWYHKPGEDLATELGVIEEVTGVLAGITGKPVISNEMGARTNTESSDPLPTNAVTDIMDSFHNVQHMPYIVWYGGPGTSSPYPVALNDINGNLTSDYGTEFRAYITSNFDDVFDNTYWQSGSPATPVTIASDPQVVITGTGGSTVFSVSIDSGATEKWIYQLFRLGDTSPVTTSAATTLTTAYSGSISTTGTYYGIVTNPAGGTYTRDGYLWNRVHVGGDTGTDATYSSGTYTVSGAGNTIGNASDVFQFVEQGAGTPRTLVTKISTSSSSGKGGLMIRDGTDADAPYIFIGLASGGGMTRHQIRATSGGGTTATVASGTAPGWLKLEWNDAGEVSCYYSTSTASTPPSSWTQLGSTATISYSDARIGLAVCGTASAASTSTFSELTVE